MLRTEPALITEYVASGLVKLQFWHILDHGNASIQASAAAECAGQQGAFWSMHDVLFENQDRLGSGDLDVLVDLAADLDLDGDTFRQCMQSDSMQERVQEVNRQTKAAGIRRRPTFDIFKADELIQRIEGPLPFANWQAILDPL